MTDNKGHKCCLILNTISSSPIVIFTFVHLIRVWTLQNRHITYTVVYIFWNSESQKIGTLLGRVLDSQAGTILQRTTQNEFLLLYINKKINYNKDVDVEFHLWLVLALDEAKQRYKNVDTPPCLSHFYAKNVFRWAANTYIAAISTEMKLCILHFPNSSCVFWP